MSILESIKEERKLSFKNWRYRLLHWCFCEDAETPEKSGLPNFLYTHYCPLFHLTNFIALLAPFILTVKIIGSVCFSIGRVFASIDWSFLKRRKVKRVKKQKEPTEADLKAQQWGQFFEKAAIHSFDSFEEFWSFFNGEKNDGYFSLLDKEEARTKHELLIKRIKEARERKAARKKQMHDSIIFWVNFSRAFVKWFLYAFYLGLAALSLWLLSLCVMPIITVVTAFFTWIFNFDVGSIIPILIFAGKIALVAAGISAIFALFYKFGIMQRMGNSAIDAIEACLPPIALIGSVVAAPCKWIVNGCYACYDFFVMFYEENCPPISIISGEEAAIEEAIEESL